VPGHRLECPAAVVLKVERAAQEVLDGIRQGLTHWVVLTPDRHVGVVFPKREKDIQRVAINRNHSDTVPNWKAIERRVGFYDATPGLCRKRRENIIGRNSEIGIDPRGKRRQLHRQISAAMKQHGKHRLRPSRTAFRRRTDNDVTPPWFIGFPSFRSRDQAAVAT